MVLLLLLPTGKVSLVVSVPLKDGDSCPPSQHRSRQLAHCPPPPPGLWESILKLYDIDRVASHRKPVHILARVLSGMVLEGRRERKVRQAPPPHACQASTHYPVLTVLTGKVAGDHNEMILLGTQTEGKGAKN